MEVSISSIPPRPKTAQSHLHQRETWRPSSGPPPAPSSDAPPCDARVEHRATPRTSRGQHLEFSIGNGVRQEGTCRNLSLGGIAIQTSQSVPFGCRVDVFMALEGIPGVTRLAGTVRWSRSGIMGLQWDSLGARVTHAILQTMAAGK